MKKIILWAFIFCLVFGLIGQQKDVLKESVQVVNVEVPVRVYFQGKPVANLTRADFKIYENRKSRKIQGFQKISKKIFLPDSLPAEGELKKTKRFFTLVFHITQYNEELRKGISHFFDQVLRASDHLLIFINNRTLSFDNLIQKKEIKSKIDKLLDEQSKKTRVQMLTAITKVERELSFNKLTQIGGGQAGSQKYQMYDFLKNYLDLWIKYKRKYLLPDVNNYTAFAKFLENVRGEKWVINFYQIENFPKIMLNSRYMQKFRELIAGWEANQNAEEDSFVVIIKRLLARINRELQVASDFPTEKIADRFAHSGATFHSVFLKTDHPRISEDLGYQRVSSDLENTLREITQQTGGELVSSNDVSSAIQEIGEKEDIYYLLTFTPRNPEDVGKIKVKTRNKKYKLFYFKNFGKEILQSLSAQDKPASAIEISQLKFKNKKIRIGIRNFSMKNDGKGALKIRVQVKNAQDSVIFDQSKSMVAGKKDINIAIDFKWLKKGEYSVVVDVEDLLTKKITTQYIKISPG